jgi:hypothetical protein
MIKIKKNKRGWIKILEAFLAITFVIGVLTILSLNHNKVVEDTFNSRIQGEQADILYIIQTNNSLRNEVLSVSEIPLESNENGFPENLNNTFVGIIPNNLECVLKICLVDSNCELNSYPEEKEIYVEKSIISSSQEVYNPTKLVVFCWRR